MGSTVAVNSLALQLNCDSAHFKQKKDIKQSFLESPCYITNHKRWKVSGLWQGVGAWGWSAKEKE